MRSRGTRVAGAAVALTAVLLGSGVRIQVALSLPTFDATRVEGMLRSDPALLYYITERIIASGGMPPADFRADRRIEHPETTDIPAMFTVGGEFLVAWAYLLSGSRMPLHVFCVWVMGIVASLAALGVYALALELTGRVSWAAFAALLYAVTPANYRTLGFVLMREDLSLPLFALHLWLLARAARVRSPASFALAALSLCLALATWHAMLFVTSVLALCVFAWYLRSGSNPLAAPRAWIFPLVLGAASLAVPVLRAKLFVLALPMQIAFALGTAAAFERNRPARAAARIAVALGAFAVAGAGCGLLASAISGASTDYAHVFELLWAKLRYAGALPADPNELPFGARLLWQGPFRTGSSDRLLRSLYAAGALMPVAIATALPAWWRGRGDDRSAVGMAFAAASIAVALLMSRLDVLCGILAPVAVAMLLRDVRPAVAAAPMLALLLVHGDLFATRMRHYRIEQWYAPRTTSELAEALGWIREHLDDDGAIAADFVNSTAILAHTRHPVVLQPKYETRRSRERIESFIEGFYRGSPEQFRRRLREQFDARYLLVHLPLLWESRYQAGLPFSLETPPPGSAAAALLALDRADYASVPGFRLLWASAQEPADFRLFALDDD